MFKCLAEAVAGYVWPIERAKRFGSTARSPFGVLAVLPFLDGEKPQVKALTTLNLFRTSVSDVGLKELAALKDLTQLTLLETKVTDVGVKELQQALPKCLIMN